MTIKDEFTNLPITKQHKYWLRAQKKAGRVNIPKRLPKKPPVVLWEFK